MREIKSAVSLAKEMANGRYKSDKERKRKREKIAHGTERKNARRTGRITRAVPSVVRSLLYRFLKVPSSLRPSRSVSLSRGRGARASLDRHPPGAAGAVAGLSLRERAAQSNLNRRARPTRGHTDDLSLPSSGLSRDA